MEAINLSVKWEQHILSWMILAKIILIWLIRLNSEHPQHCLLVVTVLNLHGYQIIRILDVLMHVVGCTLLLSVLHRWWPHVTNFQCTFGFLRFHLPIGYNGRASSVVVSGRLEQMSFNPGVHHKILAERVLSAVSSLKSLFCVPSFALLIDYFSLFLEDKDIQQETPVLILVHLRSLILNLRWLASYESYIYLLLWL